MCKHRACLVFDYFRIFLWLFFIPVLLAHLPLGLLGFKLEDVLISTGPWVLVVSAIIVFIESGVLFPVLPGDSLIFALGMLHDRMGLSLWLAFPVLIIAAVVGGEVGYQLGARYGRNLFKDDAKILSTKNLHAAEEFFAKRGGFALVVGRFVPIVRTFVSLAAGISSYPRRRFNLWIFWVPSCGLVLLVWQACCWVVSSSSTTILRCLRSLLCWFRFCP